MASASATEIVLGTGCGIVAGVAVIPGWVCAGTTVADIRGAGVAIVCTRQSVQDENTTGDGITRVCCAGVLVVAGDLKTSTTARSAFVADGADVVVIARRVIVSRNMFADSIGACVAGAWIAVVRAVA